MGSFSQKNGLLFVKIIWHRVKVEQRLLLCSAAFWHLLSSFEAETSASSLRPPGAVGRRVSVRETARADVIAGGQRTEKGEHNVGDLPEALLISWQKQKTVNLLSLVM